ncbi:MAG: hypothetical protein J6S91_14115 [Treponema sp.]|nr:hypothetical protein [Treponema sp.]
MIYNASAYKEEKDQRVRDFLHFVCTNEPGPDDFTRRLSDIVERLKDNEKFKGDYLAMNLHDRDLIRRTRKEAIEEGIFQGSSRKALEDAENLLRMGMGSAEQISKAIGLPLEKVQEIADRMSINS